MVQPKTPPLSIRPGEARLACIDDFATRKKLNRHAAVLALIDDGLRANGPSLPPPDVQAAIKAEAVRRQSKVMATRAARPEPIHVDAPQLGTFERRPYQKGTKR